MRVALLVPGSIATVSGGYGYDRAILAGLRAAGHDVTVTELAGRHPLPDAAAVAAARAAWAALPADAVPVIDGLGLPSFQGVLDARAVGLIHHPTQGRDRRRRARGAAGDGAGDVSRRCRAIVTSAPTAARLAAEFAVDAAAGGGAGHG